MNYFILETNEKDKSEWVLFDNTNYGFIKKVFDELVEKPDFNYKLCGTNEPIDTCCDWDILAEKGGKITKQKNHDILEFNEIVIEHIKKIVWLMDDILTVNDSMTAKYNLQDEFFNKYLPTGSEYPFKLSFDDQARKIEEWGDCIKDNVEKLKKEWGVNNGF